MAAVEQLPPSQRVSGQRTGIFGPGLSRELERMEKQ